MDPYKAVIIAVFLIGVFSLFSGLFFMLKGRDGEKKTVRAYGFRVGFSIFAFLLAIALTLWQQH